MPQTQERMIRRLFDTLTPRYGLFNRIASLGLDQGWRRRTIDALQLVPGMTVLDLASGTGDLAAEAVRRLVPLGRVAACDLSLPMLQAASRRFAAHPLAGWHAGCSQGKAEQLPFASGRFNAACVGFALRNVSDLEAAFRELHRVLHPGGRLALLEFGRPENLLLRAGHWIWLTFAIPLLGLLTTRRMWPFLYLRRSILQFIPPGEVVRRLERAGFAQPASQPMAGGIVRLYTAARR